MSTKQKTGTLIVGAGAAGLYAADRLDRAGMPFLILEAGDHSGGRVFSRPEMMTELGLTLDEGANLINSTDRLAIGLLNRFSIPYVRRLRAATDSMHYVYDGVVLDQAQMDDLIYRENGRALQSMAQDRQDWRAMADPALDERFTDESIAAYLQRCGAGRSLVTLMRSFFWSEYGHELHELNVHVLFDYIDLDSFEGSFRLIPNADESYTVPGGTGEIFARLEETVRDRLRLGRRVSRIEDDDDGRIRVLARRSDGEEEVYKARTIVFAAPLHSLRHIWVAVQGISPQALNEARAATYASGTKLHLKFRAGFHQIYRFTGILTTDTGEQIWPSSVGQGDAGLLTVLTGPLPPGEAATHERARSVLAILERVAPGVSALYAGVERTDAPMSYSGSLRPGESRDLDIHDGSMNWLTIGEASGGELQGYLEGALRSADRQISRLIRRSRRKLREPATPAAEAATRAAMDIKVRT